METLDHGPSRRRGGNEERVGEVVDLDLLLRYSKNQQVWVVEEGDLLILVAQLEVVKEECTS